VAGVGLFLAFWSWVGFEAIPNYAEESKDPKRNVPRATLIAVIGLGVGYVLTSMAFESAFPKDQVIEAAQDPAGPFFVAMDAFGPHLFTIIMQVLILTGAFACAMAFHNVTMRYFYATGREGILPRALGRTHGKHEVPHIANITQTVIAIVIMVLWGIFSGFGYDMAFDGAYVRVYTMMAVQGVVWILAIQALCALAIIVYFRTGGRSGNVITTVICPIIAIVGQVFAIFLLFKNITAISFDITYTGWIMWIAIVVTAATIVYAFVLKSTNREKFDKVGRVIDDTGNL
jgi:amino acid transporter